MDYFKKIFFEKFDDDQIAVVKEEIVEKDVTLVFEVIDSVNDPHIIEYNESRIVLLDLIYNKTYYSKMPYEELQKFGEKTGIEIKRLVYTAADLDTFKDIYEDITSKDYKLDGEYVEGFVIEDNDNFMVKIKSFYYDKWKSLRSKMEKALKTGNYDLGKDELEKAFMQHLKLKYENKEFDIRNVDIITERKKFENGKL